MDMKQRKQWNENHKRLKEIIGTPEEHENTIQLFLSQHSLLHSSKICDTSQLTLQDVLFKNLDETTFRQYPVRASDTKNSIAWHLWHITRIEDMTMNILVADDQQVLYTTEWLKDMAISYTHSGNDMTEEEIAVLSKEINCDSLLSYRAAVGKKTRDVISALEPGQFRERIPTDRIDRLFEENAVMQKSKWLADYWGKKNIAGLILMPATRHIFLHLNKCVRIKEKIQKKG